MSVAVDVSYYTDPACPWSWAMEPTLRRLEAEFGSELRLAVVMAGIAREFGAPERTATAWLDGADRSAIPVDPRLWLAAPPASSYPACLAYCAAREQLARAPAAVAAYLRRLREGFAFRRRRLDRPEALLAAAEGIADLDLDRLRRAVASSATIEQFAVDLERSRAAAAGAPPPLPVVVIAAGDGREQRLTGFVGVEEAREAVRTAGAVGRWERSDGRPPTVEEALRAYGTLATAEVAAICDLPAPRAAAELWQLATAWRARGERHLTEWLWHATA